MVESLTSRRVVREIIEKYGFSFSKSLGQNFLVDGNILKKIISSAHIGPEDKVLEIGPGIGTVTRELAIMVKEVTAVEIDKALIPILNETVGHYSNVRIIHDDILKIDMGQLVRQFFPEGSFKIIGNLPYYITTPIIMKLLEKEVPFCDMVVMVQKEVAQRMGALPGTKNYGALSVAVQYYTLPSIVARVPATVFMPPPKVDSMIILLSRRKAPPVDVKDRQLMFDLVKAAFAQRRKTLINNLVAAGLPANDREKVREMLLSCGIDPVRRGETLSLEEFASIANALYEIMK